jgi:hypothetical protein
VRSESRRTGSWVISGRRSPRTRSGPVTTVARDRTRAPSAPARRAARSAVPDPPARCRGRWRGGRRRDGRQRDVRWLDRDRWPGRRTSSSPEPRPCRPAGTPTATANRDRPRGTSSAPVAGGTGPGDHPYPGGSHRCPGLPSAHRTSTVVQPMPHRRQLYVPRDVLQSRPRHSLQEALSIG